MSNHAPLQDPKKIAVFGATGTIGKAVVAALSPKYEVLQVGNRQGEFTADGQLIDQTLVKNPLAGQYGMPLVSGSDLDPEGRLVVAGFDDWGSGDAYRLHFELARFGTADDLAPPHREIPELPQVPNGSFGFTDIELPLLVVTISKSPDAPGAPEAPAPQPVPFFSLARATVRSPRSRRPAA